MTVQISERSPFNLWLGKEWKNALPSRWRCVKPVKHHWQLSLGEPKVYMWIRSLIAELERERGMRVFVFPRLMQQGKLTQLEAQERLALLSATIDLLKLLIDRGVHQTDQLPLRLTPKPPLTTGGSTSLNSHSIKGCE